tara:strand:+ start:1539 stop:1877 length:339 start_codon:yes stop_codon:yes gene_type:complete
MNVDDIENNIKEDGLYRPLVTPTHNPKEKLRFNKHDVPNNHEIQKAITMAFNFLMSHEKIKAFGSIYALEKALGLSNATIANAKKHQHPTYSTVVKLAHLAGERAHKIIGDL